MENIYLQKLKLSNYRNFHDLELSVDNNSVILVGGNGSGKTNVLEAISLFFPGKGLRTAKLEDILKREEDHCVAYTLLQSKMGPVEITTTLQRGTSKRVTECNGSKMQNNELSRFTSMIWLTPQMDGIFFAGPSDRRKFFDRIVYNYIPEHAHLVSQYEYYMSTRSKILSSEAIDKNWLSIVEEKMAQLSLEIAINRLKILKNIQQAVDDLESNFPKAILLINGVIEEKILNNETVDVNWIKEALLRSRKQDQLSNRTNFGVHKSDFVVIHQEKNTVAKHCSTGEQKSMLISIMLAQVNYSIKENISMPILLLDEVFVHLDTTRRDNLIEILLRLGLQIWVSATDLNGIELLAKKTQLINL